MHVGKHLAAASANPIKVLTRLPCCFRFEEGIKIAHHANILIEEHAFKAVIPSFMKRGCFFAPILGKEVSEFFYRRFRKMPTRCVVLMLREFSQSSDVLWCRKKEAAEAYGITPKRRSTPRIFRAFSETQVFPKSELSCWYEESLSSTSVRDKASFRLFSPNRRGSLRSHFEEVR